MTTLIYSPDAGVVAADSLETGNALKMECDKLFRINGHIIGTAGGSYSGLRFVWWFSKWAGEPDFGDWPDLTHISEDEDFECLVVRPDRTCYTINRLFIPYEMKPLRPVGLGSGAGPALGALYAGATPREAVKIACQLDIYSSGPVRSMKI